MRKFQFQTGEYYHIYNRGVDKRKIFVDSKDYIRFIRSMIEFNSIKKSGSLYQLSKLKTSDVFAIRRMSKLVKFISYCLNPNHFILKQLAERGMSEFMKRLGDG